MESLNNVTHAVQQWWFYYPLADIEILFPKSKFHQISREISLQP
jgi:hypothetical protein